jgi:hypothetical protein
MGERVQGEVRFMQMLPQAGGEQTVMGNKK